MKTLTFKDKMMVAGHRGDCYNCFENTMKAFECAINDGADMIETDVRLTKDGVLVLMHDDKVDRTSHGSGLVCEKTNEELLQLNVGGKTEPAVIPTLEELLQLLSERNILLNLEVKEYYTPGNEARCAECIEKCIALIEKYDFHEKMVFNSFDAYVLEYIAEKYPDRYLLHGFYPYSIMQNVKRNPDEYLYCACLFSMNPANYRYLQSKNIEPWIGAGVTIESRLKECFDMGAKLITTNFPADAIKKLERIGAR